jgi:hypothetical protein
MTKAKIMKLKSGDVVTVKEQQKSYEFWKISEEGKGYPCRMMIYPGTRIMVNHPSAPYVFRIPGNDGGFLSGYVLDDQGKKIVCCGVKWANVAEL